MTTMPHNGKRSGGPLPGLLRPFFWDRDFRRMSLRSDADFIIGRLLAEGTWDAVKRLRRRLGDEALREWFTRHSGRGLAPRNLRFWEAVLRLDPRKVNIWIARQKENPWHRRTGARHSTPMS